MVLARLGDVRPARRQWNQSRRAPFVMEALERRRVLSAGHIDPGFPTGSALAHEVADADVPDHQVNVDLYPLANGQTLTLRTHLVPPVIDASDFQAYVKRFNADGSLDRSFGDDGEALVAWGGQFPRILVRPDGKIVIYEQYGWDVTQLNPDGSPDRTFGDGGHVDWSSFPDFHFTAGVVNLALTRDGGLVFTADVYNYPGFDPVYGGSMIGRLLPDGTVDRSFGQGGRIMTDRSGFMPNENIRVLSDGSIVVDDGTALWRLRPDGSADPAFTPFTVGGNGEALGDFIVESDGRVVVMSAGDGGLIRLNADGSLDETFHRGGGPDGPWRPQDPFRGWDESQFPPSDEDWDVNEFEWSRLLRQADGKYVLGGEAWRWDEGGSSDHSVLVVTRFNPDGTVDRTFGYDGSVQLDYTGYDKAAMSLQAAAVTPDGGILLSAGVADWGWWHRGEHVEQPHVRGLIRLTADGQATPGTTSIDGFAEAAPPPRVPSGLEDDGEEDPEPESPPADNADTDAGVDVPDDGEAEGGGGIVGMPGGLADGHDAVRDVGDDPARQTLFAVEGRAPFDWTEPDKEVWD